MIPLRQLFSQYKKEHKALPAFNIDSFEIYQAVEDAVKETSLPCLVQLSPSEDNFIDAKRLLMLVKKANSDGLPIYLNMDHGKNIDRLEKLVRLGYDMIHFDGSPLEFSQNLQITKYLVEKIRSFSPDTLIETEFNRINPSATELSPDSFTNPKQAFDFISQTKGDLLAVSVGNLHGVSFDYPERVNLPLLSEISTSLPQTLLTLHGGSGISPDQISAAIKLGVVKININTDLRLKFKESLKRNLPLFQSEKLYELLIPIIADLKEVIKTKLIQFSSNV